jgi:hypothetical protein
MLKVSPALNGPCVAEARAFTSASSAMMQRVEPHEPLSVPDQVVAEMFAVPPVLQVSHASITNATTIYDGPTRERESSGEIHDIRWSHQRA